MLFMVVLILLMLLAGCEIEAETAASPAAVTEELPTESSPTATPPPTSTELPTATSTPETDLFQVERMDDNTLPEGAIAQYQIPPAIGIAASPAGDAVAIGTFDGVGVYNLQDEQVVWFDEIDGGVEGGFETLAWSPDGSTIAVATSYTSDDTAKIILWNAARGSRFFEFETYNRMSPQVSDIGFSCDGNYIAAAFLSGISIWDVETGALYERLDNMDILQFAWAPHNMRIAVVTGQNRDVCIYDLDTNKYDLCLESYSIPAAFSVGWLPSGDSIAITSNELSETPAQIIVWNIEADQVSILDDMLPSAVYVDINPNGDFLAVAGREGIYLWKLRDNTTTMEFLVSAQGGMYLDFPSEQSNILFTVSGTSHESSTFTVWSSADIFEGP